MKRKIPFKDNITVLLRRSKSLTQYIQIRSQSVPYLSLKLGRKDMDTLISNDCTSESSDEEPLEKEDNFVCVCGLYKKTGRRRPHIKKITDGFPDR